MVNAGVDSCHDVVPGNDGKIKIHTMEDFVGMRRAGALAASCLDMLIPYVLPGVTTGAIDDRVRTYFLDHGAVPATLFYRGYAKSSCISVNHVICHGIPGDRPLKDGDIVNIDVTCVLDGWHGDTSRMFPVGTTRCKAEQLISATYGAMTAGIEQICPGARFGDIGWAIQQYAQSRRLSIVRDFCGHGLGRLFHDAPNVFHFGEPGSGEILRTGMFFTVEPMLNAGKPEAKVLADGWTAVTRDRSLSAQFEHSVGVTEDGVEIFTRSPAGLNHPPYR